MQPLWRLLMVSALALPGTAALGQSAPPADPAASAPSADPIGPPQLSNFSLSGKVTQPAAALQQNPQSQPIAKPSGRSADRQSAEVTNSAPAPAPKTETARTAPARRSTQAAAPPTSPSQSLSAFTSPAPPQPLSPVISAPAAAIERPVAGTQFAWLSSLLWLLAAAVAGGAAAWYFLWQRPRAGPVPAGIASAFDAQPPEPALPPARPVAQPRPGPPTPKPAGVVSTRLRPWVEFQFTPGRVVLDDEKAVLEFEMALFNSGSAPARDILVEGAMFNAGPAQDQQIAAFFENPVGKGNRLPLLAPLQRLAISSAISLPRSQLIPLEFEGRPLLVPMAGFNALYRWGSNSNGQSSASYLVGKQTNGEKLAPFRLDLGPRVFRRLAAREHELRVRK